MKNGFFENCSVGFYLWSEISHPYTGIRLARLKSGAVVVQLEANRGSRVRDDLSTKSEKLINHVKMAISNYLRLYEGAGRSWLKNDESEKMAKQTFVVWDLREILSRHQ